MWQWNDYSELYHHGILGMKWGVKNGPPYALSRHSSSERNSGYTKSELGKRNDHLYDRNEAEQARIRYWKAKGYSAPPKKKYTVSGGKYINTDSADRVVRRRVRPNSIYNKKNFDRRLKKGTSISTLSYDPDRTKNTDMFYGTHTYLDRQQYRALFNQKAPRSIYDDSGKSIGTGRGYKFDIKNIATKNIDVASEKSAADVFIDLYTKDRDFYRFVKDNLRMRSMFNDDKLKFKGYKEAVGVLQQIQNGKTPTSQDLRTVYRLFNYVLPYDGQGDAGRAADIQRQRAKFFDALSSKGYEALLDTNDAIYGGFKAESPVIVFDMTAVTLGSISDTDTKDKIIADLALVGRKVLGI